MASTAIGREANARNATHLDMSFTNASASARCEKALSRAIAQERAQLAAANQTIETLAHELETAEAAARPERS